MTSSIKPSTSLNVYWEADLVGSLYQEDGDSLEFEYAKIWLESGRPAISFSLPLQSKRFGKEAHNFFGNLLPEGDFRRKIERLFKVSPDNDFSLLAQIGGDCAGALSIGVEAENEGGFYEEISSDELKRIIFSEGVSGIIQPGHHNRLSLAGAQGKLPVRFRDSKLEMPHAGAASTHILKFNRRSEPYPKLVENEYFTTAVAKRLP